MGDPRGGRETSAGGQVSSGLRPRPQPSMPALGPGGGPILLWRPRPSLQLSPALAQPSRAPACFLPQSGPHLPEQPPC